MITLNNANLIPFIRISIQGKSKFISDNRLVDLQQHHSFLFLQFLRLDRKRVHNSLLFDQLSFHCVPLFLFLVKIVLENVNSIVHVPHSLIFLLDAVYLLFVLLSQPINLALQLIALHFGLVDSYVKFDRFSAMLLVDLGMLLFVVFVEPPVGVCLVAASRLSRNFFFQIRHPFFQFALLHQQLGIDLS